MTIAYAERIRIVWGRFMEYSLGKLCIALSNKIQLSFLSYHKEILIEAFELIQKYSHKLRNKRMIELMQEIAANLISFVNDEEAFIIAAERHNDPKWRRAYMKALKEFQKTWITTQDAPES